MITNRILRKTHTLRTVVLCIAALAILIAPAALLCAQTEFAYVANSGSRSVSVYSVDSVTGVLSQVVGSPFPAGSFPQSIVVDPSGRFAYVANYGSNNISAYAIDFKTGGLTQIAGSPFAGGGGPQSVVIDPAGGFAYVANSLANSVSVYAVDPSNGSLTEISGSPFAAGTVPISLTLDSVGHFAYVANLNSNDIWAYAVQTGGSLVPIAGSPFAAGGGPFSVAVDPLNRFAYAANSIGSVSAYAVDSLTGALTQIAGSPFAVGDGAASVTVDLSGRFAYVSGGSFAAPGYVAGFSIDGSTGALTPVPGSPFTAGVGPWSVAGDPSGKFVYAANVFITSNNLSAYAVNSDSGELSPVPGSPFATGLNPRSVIVVRIGGSGTSTSLASSLNPSTYGQPVTFTAHVTSNSGTPTGAVILRNGSTTVGNGTLTNGRASIVVSSLPAGSDSITAAYQGSGAFAPSTSAPLTQSVTTATTATFLASSLNPAGTNQAVTFTATVTSQFGGAATGSVTFYSGTQTLGTASLAGNLATLTTSFATPGNFSITAKYNGDGNNSGSTSSALSQKIIASTTTTLVSSLNPSFVGQAVTFTATVSSISGAPPNGELIIFKNGSSVLGTAPLSGGIASLTTSSLAAGVHTITASYAGDANFAASTSPGLRQVVNSTTKSTTSTTLSSSLNPSIYGQKITWTATVTTSGPVPPTGTVTFSWSTNTIGSATLNSSGVAILSKSNLNAYTYPLVAMYKGDASNLASTSTILSQVVKQAASTATLTSSPNPSTLGQAVTFTAKITSPTVVPTGPVTFKIGNTVLGTAQLSAGKATFTTSTLPVGSTIVTATYPWNSNIAASSASVTQNVGQ